MKHQIDGIYGIIFWDLNDFKQYLCIDKQCFCTDLTGILDAELINECFVVMAIDNCRVREGVVYRGECSLAGNCWAHLAFAAGTA